MKNNNLFYLVCLALLVFSGQLHGQTNLYVATNGNDSNSGAISSPLKTLIGARNKVRSIKSSSGLPGGGIVVNFRGGTYPLTTTCYMDAQDAGESSKPIVYRGYGNEKVIFDGSLFVSNSAFQTTTSSQAGKLHSSAVGNVLYQTLTDANIISALQSDEAQMSMNGRMMTISRFPNMGFGHINQSTITAGYETNRAIGTFSDPKGARFKLHDSFDASKWAAEIIRTKRVTVKGYLSAQWHKETILVASGTGGWIRLKDGSSYGVGRPKTLGDPNRLFVAQILCELNEPGEWYFDKTDNTLYVWPFETINGSTKIGVWAGTMMVRITNGQHIHFTHMTIQNIGKGVNGDAALDFRSGNNFFVAGVTFRNIVYPITGVNTWADVANTEIRSCDFIDNFGSSRLYGGSFNSTGTIIRGNNRIVNCHFTQVYSKDFYGKATHIGGVNNVFKNNLVHNINGQPITHAGIDHYMALNEVFNVGVEEGDGGAFYTGNDVMSYGNRIKHNFVHHIMDIPSLYHRASFFSDDFDGGETMEQNVLFKGGGEAIKMNRGAGHSVLANVILDCGLGIKQSNGGSSQYNTCMQYINSTNGKSPTSGDKVNYIGRMLQKIGTPNWQSGLSESNWNSRIEQFWKNRYPYFRDVMNAYSNNNQMNPYQCRFYDNMYWSNGYGNESSGSATVLRNRNIDLSIFVNPDNLNFKFNSSKPSFAPNIPFENIGLYADAYRCAVPDKDTYRRAIKQRFINLECRTNDSYNPATINARLYYNSGKAIYDLLPCAGITTPDTQGPYQGVAQLIPGTIEAERYDVGGENIAYHDNDATNNGGQFRPTEGVDLANHDGGGIVIGWTNAAEWTEYTVNASGGNYNIEARVASPHSGKRVFVIIDGNTHTINVPNTGAWASYQTVTLSNISVAAGNGKVIRFTYPDGGINLNWIKFTATNSTGSSITLGNPSTTNATHDGWKSNMVVNETDTYTNTSGGQERVTINKFNFYAWQKADPVTPFVVKVNGDNNFFVLAIGTTRASSAYTVGANSLDFKTGGSTITINNNDKIAVGFLDANENGSGSGSGSVIPFDGSSPDQIWYTGGPQGSNSGRLSVGSAPVEGTNILTNLSRNYHFNIEMTTTSLKRSDDLDQKGSVSGLVLYPNPTSSVLNIEIIGALDSQASLMIYNSIGSMVQSLKITNRNQVIDVSEFPEGMYILKYGNGISHNIQKFIKN